MDVNIANRLCELRKKNNYSQEELADKLGLSRQAVSKWERAEASPDTDNLIMLAELYGMTLDELLFGNNESRTTTDKETDNDSFDSTIHINKKGGDYVNIGKDGVHVISEDGDEVHIDTFGMRIFDKNCKNKHLKVNSENSVNVSLKGRLWLTLPFPMIIATAYVVLGVVGNWWHPAWLLFLLIPIYYDFVKMFVAKTLYGKLHAFPVVMLSTLTYLCLGFFNSMWHPSWLVFLLIPLYYTVIDNVCPKRTVTIDTDDDDR